MLRGGYEIFNRVKQKLSIENLQVTDDKIFSLEEVECMGSCGTAPMIAVNEDYYENLDKEKVEQLLNSFKDKN
jgi:NADH:ubiquinone oxidoreductase subunit E